MLLNSCVFRDVVYTEQIFKQIIADSDTAYTSSIIIDNGLNKAEYLIELAYAEPVDSSFSELLIENPQFDLRQLTQQSLIYTAKNYDNYAVCKYLHKNSYLFEFEEFSIPVFWEEENALLFGNYQFSVIEPEIEVLPPEIIPLEDEFHHDVCFERYLIKCSLLIKNSEDNISTASSVRIVKIPWYPIIFDRPNVDDWTEEEVEI